jgi:hypothetical protein
MIIILGLIILIAAVIVGVAGVLSNGGSTHALTHGFAVFGYHVTGSTGTLFLYGIVVGALALFGLTVLLAGARRTSRRGRATRRELKQSRRETAVASQARDDLIDQRDSARAAMAGSTAAAQPSASQSGTAQPSASQSGTAQPSASQSGTAQSAAQPSAAPTNGTPRAGRRLSSSERPLGRPRLFLRPSGSRRATGTDSERPTSQPAAGVVDDAPARNVPAGASAPAE